jgi:hypothetical protein
VFGSRWPQFGHRGQGTKARPDPWLDPLRNATLICIKHLAIRMLSFGAVAQLGERMTGSHEVRGSIPLGSTNTFETKGHPAAGGP